MHRIRFLYKYLYHFITAIHTRGYGAHSPYIFQFTRYVLQERYSFYTFEKIEMLRKNLKKDKRQINITDFGTGKNRRSTISLVSYKSLKSAKYAQLLFRIAHYTKAKEILEFGTSFGISTIYLASCSSDIHCISMEGCPETAKIALENFNKLRIKNIDLVIGSIDETLNNTLKRFNHIDLIFIDANHSFNAVIEYFEKCIPKMNKNSILVIDDIYWSNGMEKAWDFIKKHPKVNSTIDLFQFGIVFLNDDLVKKNYKMRY